MKTLSNIIEEYYISAKPFAIDWQCFLPDPTTPHYEDIRAFTKNYLHFQEKKEEKKSAK
jgi:hypothetical protein